MYWLDLLRLLDLLGLLALLPLTISARMDSRIKASIIPAWFILISLKVDFYQLYYTAKVQKSQLRWVKTAQKTTLRTSDRCHWCGPARGFPPVTISRIGVPPRLSDVIVRKSGGLPHQSADWLAMTVLLFGLFVFLRQTRNSYPCFFRFSELLARTAEVIWMKSLTYFFTFSPLR